MNLAVTANKLLDPQWLVGRGRLAQSIRLEESGPSRLLNVAIGSIVTILILFIVWASITSVGEVASASGEVTPVGSIKRVQHLEGGIVSAIYVRDGDLVQQGQVLMNLANGATAPELEQMQARLVALELQESQLDALTHGGEAAPASKDKRFGALAATQASLLQSKRDQLESAIDMLERQLEQRRADLAQQLQQANRVREEIAILEEQILVRSTLVAKGFSSRMALLDQKRERARVQTQLAEIDGQIERSHSAIKEAQARIAEERARSRRDTSQEIGNVRGQIAELREALARADDRVKRLAVRAPVRGIVSGLQTETIGGVIAPGSTILEVMPVDALLVVEARVAPKDIGFVRDGQAVTVKVLTYDYTRFGTIDGRIDTISPTTLFDEKGVPYYRARIGLKRNFVGSDPRRNLVIPGMTVMADIHTGEKTVLAYLLKPLALATGEALHER